MKSTDSFIDYRANIDYDLEQVVKRIRAEEAKRIYIKYTSYPLTKLKKELVDAFSIFGVQDIDMFSLKISIPPEQVNADIAFPIFGFSKAAKKAPNLVAIEIARILNTSRKGVIESAVAVGGYVNICLSKKAFFKNVVNSVLTLREDFGESDQYRDKSVFVDYSSPNIAKPFGIGHLRSTVIGEALARVYGALGYTVIRDNHLGDWGTQFGALIYAFRKWGDENVIKANPIEELKSLYVRFSAEAEENLGLKEEARKIFSDLENGDPELMALWNKFRDLSVAEFEKTYKELNINFDIALGESYYAKGSEILVKDLEDKGIATLGKDSAVVVEGLDKLPTFLVQKGDGSTLYVLRDAQAIIHRRKVFNPSVILYVVGVEQELNFKQLFALVKAAKYSGDIEMRHIGFGLVLVDGKKMATRKGTLINLSDVISQITEKAKDIMVTKGESGEKEIIETSKKIALSAVVYNDLRQNRLSDVEFDWKKMLSLDSGSVVYIQYTYARIFSILKKIGAVESISLDGFTDLNFEDPIEFRLALKLSFYPEVLLQVIENDTPHLVCDFLESLTSDINRFYASVSVITTKDSQLKHSRILLLKSVLVCMDNAFRILNIPIIEKL